MLTSAADHQRLLYFIPLYSKQSTSLTSSMQTSMTPTACSCPCSSCYHKGFGLKGQVLPALSGKMPVATGLPGAHESTSMQPWRSALLGYSCITHSVTGGWMKCGPSHLLGGITEADMSFQEESFAPASLNPSKCSASGCC